MHLKAEDVVETSIDCDIGYLITIGNNDANSLEDTGKGLEISHQSTPSMDDWFEPLRLLKFQKINLMGIDEVTVER